MSGLTRQCRGMIAQLTAATSGVAAIELAYIAPIFMILLGSGLELTNYSLNHMRVSQIAVSLADNASRAKESVVSGVPRMREADVNQAFAAAQLQSGGLDVKANGKLILSSLEVNAQGGQWIHWQRCYGAANYTSSYGKQGDGLTGTAIKEIGPTDRKVSAEPGFAIMFVEVAYNYKPLMFGQILKDAVIRKTAAMYVRDQRELSQIYNLSPTVSVSACS